MAQTGSSPRAKGSAPNRTLDPKRSCLEENRLSGGRLTGSRDPRGAERGRLSRPPRDTLRFLGAAQIRLVIGDRVLHFSGDLGQADDPLMRPPEPFDGADVLVREST